MERVFGAWPGEAVFAFSPSGKLPKVLRRQDFPLRRTSEGACQPTPSRRMDDRILSHYHGSATAALLASSHTGRIARIGQCRAVAETRPLTPRSPPSPVSP